MKKSSNGAMHHNRQSFAKNQRSFLTIITIAIASSFLLSSCQKESSNSKVDEIQTAASKKLEGNAVDLYNGLSDKTSWELKQVRAATARYRNIENAIKDGYQDIAVDVQGMGHHFMKMSIVDATFDLRQPEILVYNKDESGEQQLVAAEYAVPLDYPRPEGFTGSADVWDHNTGFGLWLLHAWVWSYNPDGVFHSTNPLIHLH